MWHLKLLQNDGVCVVWDAEDEGHVEVVGRVRHGHARVAPGAAHQLACALIM